MKVFKRKNDKNGTNNSKTDVLFTKGKNRSRFKNKNDKDKDRIKMKKMIRNTKVFVE